MACPVPDCLFPLLRWALTFAYTQQLRSVIVTAIVIATLP